MYDNRMTLIIRLFSESFRDILCLIWHPQYIKKFSPCVQKSAILVRGSSELVESSDDHAGVHGERAQEPLLWIYPYFKRSVDWKLIQGETF